MPDIGQLRTKTHPALSDAQVGSPLFEGGAPVEGGYVAVRSIATLSDEEKARYRNGDAVIVSRK